MKILMINLPFAGHTNPTLPLTTKLVEKGHEVFYINAPEFREKIEKTGAKFIPYKDYPLKVTEGYKKRHCFRAAFETAMDFEEQIDILIYEMFFYPGVEIAKRKGIPCVRQFSQPAWSEETWKAAPKIFKISAKLIDMQVLKKSDATRLGLENKCLKDGIINCHPDLNIEYLSEQFQSKKDSFDETYTYIIPTPNVMKGNVTIPYEQMNHPIIYISLGSIISDKSFYKKCVKTFRDKPFSVILNTGKVDPSTLGKMPENIYAYSFVPQVEVLSHADVFLTHCGMNSINEAMCYGVPMIAMPFMNDQITNAKQLVELGLAKQIRSLFNTSDEIYRAACDVASDEQMKEKARMMMENIKQQVSWDEIIRRIESLV